MDKGALETLIEGSKSYEDTMLTSLGIITNKYEEFRYNVKDLTPKDIALAKNYHNFLIKQIMADIEIEREKQRHWEVQLKGWTKKNSNLVKFPFEKT